MVMPVCKMAVHFWDTWLQFVDNLEPMTASEPWLKMLNLFFCCDFILGNRFLHGSCSQLQFFLALDSVCFVNTCCHNRCWLYAVFWRWALLVSLKQTPGSTWAQFFRGMTWRGVAGYANLPITVTSSIAQVAFFLYRSVHPLQPSKTLNWMAFITAFLRTW